MPDYRLRYTKLGKVRFLGHRDLARCWERGLRQAGAPLAFSQGFTPHPKVSFGLALATGVESEAEYLDVQTTAPLTDAMRGGLASSLPAGVEVRGHAEIRPGAASLMAETAAVTYAVYAFHATAEQLADAARAVLAAPRLDVVVRRKAGERVEDVRPAILDASVEIRDGEPTLTVLLSTRPHPVRPGEVLAAAGTCGIHLRERLSRRTAQWFQIDDAFVDPLDTDRVATVQ